jgi:capsid assembly protease
MKLLDVLNAPWAIQPEKLREIQAIYLTHLRGEKIDVQAVERQLGKPLLNEQTPVTVIDGVAVLHVNGVMAKRMNMFTQISGGVSTQLAIRDLEQAVQDTSVHSIVQVYDTPGGTVDGTLAFADAIKKASAVKPVVALADGMMASAGYWSGSSARGVYITESTTAVGSIGVASQHVDVSAADQQSGIKRTDIFAGKYKRIASENGPLTEAGRKSIQDQVDYIYSLFVQAVAANRGVSIDRVLRDMADGRVFYGEQAIAAGLVDGVSTLDELIAQLNRERSAGVAPRGAAEASVRPIPKPTPGAAMPSITREQLAAEAPDVLAAILAEGHAAGVTAGATTERARIQGIEAQALPGHEALITALKFDGKSSPGDAAMAITAAERSLRTAHAAATANDAPEPVASGATKPVMPGATGEPLTRAQIDAKAKAYQAAHPGTDYVAAVKAIQQGA